jgi:hypothetical protein
MKVLEEGAAFEGVDAECVLSKISAAVEGDGTYSDAFWGLACDALSRVGKETWWHCDCGVISPLRGEMDAICDRCGAFRRVGMRLSRSVWVLYVQCLCRVYPGDWFERLLKWCESEGVGEILIEAQTAEGGAYPDEVPDSVAESAAYGGAIAAQGVAAYGGAIAAQGVAAYGGAIAAQGGSPLRERILVCVDGMRISSQGVVWGTQWIALPLPLLYDLEEILRKHV